MENKKVFTAKQAKDFDIRLRVKIVVPGIILMENAGKNTAEIALGMLGKRKKVVIFCGKGNNGGDGYAAARHLLSRGKDVLILLVGSKKEVKGDALTNLNIVSRMGIKIYEIKNEKMLRSKEARCKDADLVIDALLGIGIKDEVRQPLKGTIEFINSLDKKVLAVDVPSGLDCQTGKSLGAAVKADKTVTFVAPKAGFYKNQGPKYTGKIIVKDIGIK